MSFLIEQSLVLKKTQIQGYSIYMLCLEISWGLMQILKIVYSKHCMHLIHDTYLD